MKALSVYGIVVAFLGVTLLCCVLGVIYLAAANPARSIPDVLVALSTGCLGTLGGMLIPRPERAAP